MRQRIKSSVKLDDLYRHICFNQQRNRFFNPHLIYIFDIGYDFS